MKKNLDEVLREKCSKINVDYNFKLPEEKVKTKYTSIIKLVAIFSILAILSIGIIMINYKNEFYNANKNNIENIQEENEVIIKSDNSVKNIIETIQYGSEMDSLAYKIEPELVVSVRIDSIVKTTNYIEKTNSYSGYPITIFNATPIKILKGEKIDKLTFYNFGGIISLAEYEKALLPVQIEKRGLNLKTQEEKENSYIEFISSLTIGIPKIEVGKTYLLLLQYDKEYFDMYHTTIKGIYEYDEKNDKIKDNSSQEWIDINLDKI